MSDKQLTGTITLPGVDPELYELTGEVRQAIKGEWFVDFDGLVNQWLDSPKSGRYYIILRRKPRKVRVTPTQADLDAAEEPPACWFKAHGREEWHERNLWAISPFTKNPCSPRFIDTNGLVWNFCEIEKEEA